MSVGYPIYIYLCRLSRAECEDVLRPALHAPHSARLFRRWDSCWAFFYRHLAPSGAITQNCRITVRRHKDRLPNLDRMDQLEDFKMKSSALQLGLLFTALIFLGLAGRAEEQETGVVWRHLSSKNGDLPAPNTGTEQTSAVVADFDKDGINDFAISERTQAPAVVWYRRNPKGWVRHILESGPLHIEAGSCAFDVDGDGDLDFVAGGDWKLNEVWWWENSFPDFDSKVSWKRHLIKNSDKPKHHDLIFGDFNWMGEMNWSSGTKTPRNSTSPLSRQIHDIRDPGH